VSRRTVALFALTFLASVVAGVCAAVVLLAMFPQLGT
jgi:cytochrome bd-type quinol oxidase subunit 1